MTSPRWTIVVHGGAGSMKRGVLPAEEDRAARDGLAAALAAGGALLGRGGSALDAVEAAVRVLEDDPQFNAGRGAVFSHEGVNELDAAIMAGATRAAGAVAGVTTSRNPVSAARAVMERSPHLLMAGAGADAFARSVGVAQVDPAWFATPERRRQLDELLAKQGSSFDAAVKYGTVGAVAVDGGGHVAAATSTGGLTGKRWGRIGDSPLIGAGTYADDRAAAVSATGSGEMFIRAAAAHELCARIRMLGEDAATATRAVLADVASLGGVGGLIAVAPDGWGGWAFNTRGMHRGRWSAGGAMETAIYDDEG